MTSYIVHDATLYYGCHGCAREAGAVAPWIRPAVNRARREVGSTKMRALLMKGVALEDLKEGSALPSDPSPGDLSDGVLGENPLLKKETFVSDH